MRAAVLPALALVLAGCFQMQSLLTVRPDGSATLREEMTLSGMGLMALASEGEDGGDPWADLDLEARAASLGEGVRLASFEPGEEGFTAVYAIDDIEAVRYSLEEGFGSGESTDGLALGYRFRFAHGADGGPATLRVYVPKPDAGKSRAPADAAPEAAEMGQALALMRSFVGDARLTVAVEVEGELLDTTAAHADGPRVTLFDLPFGPFLDAVAENPAWMAGGTPDPTALYGELDAIEGVRVQPPGTVRVRFR